MNLPKNENTFHFECIGESTGEKYEGEFTVICIPDIRTKHLIELEKSRYLVDAINPTNRLIAIATIFADFKHLIIQSPKWWEENGFGLKILDENIIADLHDKIIAAGNKWKEDLLKLKEQK